MTLDEAREAARRAWAEERDTRDDRDTLLSAVTKVKRALDDKDRAGLPLTQLPKLTQAEIEAVRADLLWWERVGNMKSVATSILDAGEFFLIDLRDWLGMFDVTRSLRGAGRPEWRPGLFAAAFVLCDWFLAANGRPPKAKLYSKSPKADVDDSSASSDGIAYDASDDVWWLADELILLDQTLAALDEKRRPLDLHQADNFIGMWREARGLKQSRKKNPSSGISGTD